MKAYKHLISKDQNNYYKATNTNINHLLKKVKEQESGEKRKNIYMAAAAISVLALSGFIISQ